MPTLRLVVRRHVWVSGRVQGVWFRQSCHEQARTVGVSGWVRNNWDGRVEAVFEGPEDRVAAMVEWCRHGPPRAQVLSLQVVVEDPESLGSFTVQGSD